MSGKGTLSLLGKFSWAVFSWSLFIYQEWQSLLWWQELSEQQGPSLSLSAFHRARKLWKPLCAQPKCIPPSRQWLELPGGQLLGTSLPGSCRCELLGFGLWLKRCITGSARKTYALSLSSIFKRNPMISQSFFLMFTCGTHISSQQGPPSCAFIP